MTLENDELMMEIYEFTNKGDIILAITKYQRQLINNGIPGVSPIIIFSSRKAFESFDEIYNNADKKEHLHFFDGTNKSFEIVEDLIVLGGINRIHFNHIKAVMVIKEGEGITRLDMLLNNGTVIGI